MSRYRWVLRSAARALPVSSPRTRYDGPQKGSDRTGPEERPLPRMSTSAEVFARFGVGWAGWYVMTRAFARALPGEPAVTVVADMLNRLDLVAAGDLDLT